VDCPGNLSNPRGNTLEHFLLVNLLSLLVLDSRIPQRPGRLYIPDVWDCVSALLHYSCARNSFDGSNCVHRFIVVQHTVLVCRHIVSRSSTWTLSQLADTWLSNGVLQPFSQLGWWRWMYRVSPFTYLIEGLFGQGLCFRFFFVIRAQLLLSHWRAANRLRISGTCSNLSS
jgi:hypothetical protein